MLWLIPADTHRQRIGILANHPLHNIGSPVPATNVSATNVWATPAGIGKALAEIALIPPTSAQGGRHNVLARAAGIGKALAETAQTPPGAAQGANHNVLAGSVGIGKALAETAQTPLASAQGGSHGGADRRCQPFPPSARR